MLNCKGLDQQMFLFTYWFLPAVGWFAAVFLDDLLSQRPAPQQRQAPKQQKKDSEKKKWYSGKRKQQ